MSGLATDRVTPLAPPAFSVGPAAWLRANLFGTPTNSVLTLLGLWFLVETAMPFLRWSVIDSVWLAPNAAPCRATEGACWAFVAEKHRFMFFGTYPYAEHWRPLVAMVAFVGLIAASCNKRFWRRSLAFAWVAGLAVIFTLMWGGVFGLSFVETARWGGLPLTLILSGFGVVAAFPAAIVLALGRRSKMPAIRAISVAYIELVRGVPLISILFMASVMFPLFLPTGVTIDKLLRAQVAIILFAAANMAEIVRGGLQAIPAGQSEAAAAIGLSYAQSIRHVVLPQALRLVIPPLVNSFIQIFKDTSLVVIIGLFDLLSATKAAMQDPGWRGFAIEAYVAVAAVYFCFCFFMSKYSQYLETDLDKARKR